MIIIVYLFFGNKIFIHISLQENSTNSSMIVGLASENEVGHRLCDTCDLLLNVHPNRLAWLNLGGQTFHCNLTIVCNKDCCCYVHLN